MPDVGVTEVLVEVHAAAVTCGELPWEETLAVSRWSAGFEQQTARDQHRDDRLHDAVNAQVGDCLRDEFRVARRVSQSLALLRT